MISAKHILKHKAKNRVLLTLLYVCYVCIPSKSSLAVKKMLTTEC